MKSIPKVSIIIPTFNRSEFLLETLESIEKQTFTNWECLVVDDGSTDKTLDVVQKFIAKNSNFKYLKRPDNIPKGACGSRNYGFNESRGKYIQWLDDDDLLSKNKLEFQVAQLESFDDWTFFTTCSWDVYWENKVYEERNILSKNEGLCKKEFFSRLVHGQTFIPVNAYLTPRKLIEASGGWNSQLLVNQDAEFYTRIILKSTKLINTPGCNVLYRIHSGDRISTGINSKTLRSLLYSYQLMHAHLKLHSIKCENFFKWKLKKVLLIYWKNDKKVFQDHKLFFAENKIFLSRIQFYLVKWEIYKIVVPFYKQHFKKKIKI